MRVVAAWVSAVAVLALVALAVVAGVANGLLVLATVCLGVHVWAVGAHRSEFWQ